MSTAENVEKALEKQEKPQSLQKMIEDSAKELARALPEHMRPERLVRIALTCIRQNPDLSKCTPQSFLGALFTSAQLGIEPIAGRAYLLPFNNNRKKPDGNWHTVKECQFVLGYKGVADLFYRHEKTINLSWGVVCSLDSFEMEQGTNSFLHHKIDYRLSDRGPIMGFWSMANLVNGGKPFHYMTLDECIEHGKKHSKTYDRKKEEWRDSSPWKADKDQVSMCLKTTLTQGAKIWPISMELQRALEADETARDIRPGVDNIIDLPSQVNWDDVEKEVEEKTQEKIE